MAASLLPATCFIVLLATSYSFQSPCIATFSRSSFILLEKRHACGQRGNDIAAIRRREFGEIVVQVAACAVLPVFSGQKASAAMMEQPKEKFFEIGITLSVDVAKARFQDARSTMVDLVNNYDSISKLGGDNVRRYLGTVGTASAMYGIEKVLKDLQNEANDIVVYTENMDDFSYYLRAADTAVYSANFVEFSAAKTKPEKFFDDAKSDCKNLLLHMDNMANELNL